MKQPIITLSSDFGDKFAEAQINLVITEINPDAKLIVGESNITAFSILEGAFIIQQLSRFAPEGSVHIGVVDPGVGSKRRGVMIKSKNFWFVGPDNGLLYPAAQKDGIEAAYLINEEVLGSLSNTFHGRDIFAKAAAHLSKGRDVTEFGTPLDRKELRTIAFKEHQIVHIDPYGNIKIFTADNTFTIGEMLTVQFLDRKMIMPYCRTFADVAKKEYLLYQGSHATLELAINLGNAAKDLGVNVGDILQIKKLTS
ncbi:MAG: SAM-dependent chlorinase/fluorinase [Patescibacteria group bacterium]